MPRVRMRTISAGPDGNYDIGAVRDVSEDEVAQLVPRYAELLPVSEQPEPELEPELEDDDNDPDWDDGTDAPVDEGPPPDPEPEAAPATKARPKRRR